MFGLCSSNSSSGDVTEPPTTNPSTTAPAVHPVVAVAREFLAAADAQQFDRAIALTAANRFPKVRLQGLRDAFRLDEAKVLEAHVAGEQAVIVTEETPSRQPDRVGTRWGLCLRKEGAMWLISDLEILVDSTAAERYVREFRESEPDAQRVETSR